MTREEMREKVAKAIEASIQDARLTRAGVMYLPEADAAIAIIRGETLEEAAVPEAQPASLMAAPVWDAAEPARAALEETK